ncbi:MAG: DUF4055 domain-containing protein [Candidatus Tenebribacter davisii]|nr:DUF4055 domain-containing protein [Candidatus Tenebribacter davisii]
MASKKQTTTTASIGAVDTVHPEYDRHKVPWMRVRDCMKGEDVVKSKKELYLPRPSGMTGERKKAYDAYLERAHFPLVVSYALSGALGIVITKLPEFNVPKQLEYILKTATKDGRSLNQLFLDIVIEIFQTGRVPLLVDVIASKNEFRFVDYKAEAFINWGINSEQEEESLSLGVLKETRPDSDDIFSHSTKDVYRVLQLVEEKYTTALYGTDGNQIVDSNVSPDLRGKPINRIPLFLAGSINNSFDMQPIPLISVANCSVQIYRKEADLANSEYLSCNPTLCIVGASNDENLPNVVGSSVMIVIPDPAARVFYTVTDTAALKHVSEHITGLYEEAIRHGVAILDARKGVEAAESLRIRQSTQSASLYSVFLSAMNAIKQGLELMCDWGGFNKEEVILDAPSSLTQGIPDSTILAQIIEGYATGVIPLDVIHRYLVYSGLLDQTIGYDDYVTLLKSDDMNLGRSPEEEGLSLKDKDGNIIGDKTKKDPDKTISDLEKKKADEKAEKRVPKKIVKK